MYELIDVIISGVTNGSVYAMMAVGLSLVYGVTKVFNFAYGSLYTLGGYLAFTFFGCGFGYPLVILLTLVSLYLAGLLTERVIIRPLRRREDWEMLAMMVTLGLAIFLDNLYQVVYGPYVKSLPIMFSGNLQLAGFMLSIQDLVIFGIAVLVMGGFMIFLNTHRLGMAIEAVAQDMTGAQIVGIPKDRVFGFTFAISTVLAGFGGILLAPKYFITPFGGWDILVKAWVITALGGMGSVRGSLYAAFLLGIIEALIGWQFGLTWILFAWFAVLLGTLIVRPQGLFGTWG